MSGLKALLETFDPSRCPVHDLMVKKSGTGYKCPRFAECGWELDRSGNPSGKYWEANKEKLDPEKKYWGEKAKVETAPRVEINGKEYVKPKKHLLSRCPMHRKKLEKAMKRDPETRKELGYYWRCPLFHECRYGVSYISHQPFGMAYEKLLKDYSKIIDDLPTAPGKSLFPKEITDHLLAAKEDGKKHFAAKEAEEIAKALSVSVPQVIRQLYKMGFDMAPSARSVEKPTSELSPIVKSLFRRKKEESVMKLSDCLLTEAAGRPLSLTGSGIDELAKENPGAYRTLPHHDGYVMGYEDFYMFRPKKGPPLFFGITNSEKRPIFDEDGEIVGVRETPAGEAAWYFFKDFDREQRQVLEKGFGFIPKNERGPKPGEMPKIARGGGAGGRKAKPIPAEHGEEKYAQISPRPAGAASGAARSQLALAKAAQRAKEPKWMKMSKEELEAALRKAMARAKSDPRYQKVVFKILDAIEKKGTVSGAHVQGLDAPTEKIQTINLTKAYTDFLKANKDASSDFRKIRKLLPKIKDLLGVEKSVEDVRYDWDQIYRGKPPVVERKSRLRDLVREAIRLFAGAENEDFCQENTTNDS